MGELQQYVSEIKRTENEKRNRKHTKTSMIITLLALAVAITGVIISLLK